MKASGKILTPSESRKFHERGEQDLAKHMLSMDDKERETFDYLREHSPGPPIQEDDEWIDEPNNDAMDVDHVLDGTNPVDLSHEGGEFYEMIEQCIESTLK
jgi:hypothetical protein